MTLRRLALAAPALLALLASLPGCGSKDSSPSPDATLLGTWVADMPATLKAAGAASVEELAAVTAKAGMADPQILERLLAEEVPLRAVALQADGTFSFLRNPGASVPVVLARGQWHRAGPVLALEGAYVPVPGVPPARGAFEMAFDVLVDGRLRQRPGPRPGFLIVFRKV